MAEMENIVAIAAKAAAKQKVARLAFWSIVVAFVVLGLKFVAWYVTGSVALYSDALESIVNVISAAAALWAIQVSHKPADQDHPFGHHKAEYFSAVLEGVLIVVAALLIIAEVWQSLADPAALEQPWQRSCDQWRRHCHQCDLGLDPDPQRPRAKVTGAGGRRPSHHDRRGHLDRGDRPVLLPLL